MSQATGSDSPYGGGPATGKPQDMIWFQYVLVFAGTLGAIVTLVAGIQALPDVRLALRCFGLAVTAASASIMGGAVLGFLFGIPRMLQTNTVPRPEDVKPSATDETARGTGVTGNTNLERVSDWITGMLVGAGFVEIDRLRTLFLKLTQQLAVGFSRMPDSGLSGVPAQAEPFATALALFLVPYFCASGFLVSYVVTRRYLPKTFVSAERDAQLVTYRENRFLGMVMQAVAGLVASAVPAFRRERGSKRDRGTAKRAGETVDEAKAAPLSAGPTEQSPLLSTKNMATSDPNKGRFGHSPERNGRRLGAKVVPLSEGDSDFFRVTLEVQSTDPARPLNEPVEFHLHPTFTHETRMVAPRNGIAALELVVWGSFTVGVVTDSGTTKLELDLAELPGVPDNFRKR